MAKFDSRAVRRLAAGVVVSYVQHKTSGKAVSQYQGEAYKKSGRVRSGHVGEWAALAGVDASRL